MYIGKDLLRRLNSVVDLPRTNKGTTQVEFVKEILDEKIRYYEDRYKNELAQIAKIKERLLQHADARKAPGRRAGG